MSNSPMFVVGIYSGADKLGEGFGTSLQMAEFRVCLPLCPQIETFCLAGFLSFFTILQAAEDSLRRLYLTQTPVDLLSLPTDTFASQRGDIFQPIADEDTKPYVPVDLGEVEVTYASKDR